jgi:N-methylhydantoinase A/oxoprolinase/acetone carboxylase beta subunit
VVALARVLVARPRFAFVDNLGRIVGEGRLAMVLAAFVERGIDPRAFALFSFGGAGGMHAVEMAAHLGMPTVIVPRNAGVLSAFGLLVSDPVKDYTRSLMRTDAQISLSQLESGFRALEEMSRRDMAEDGFDPAKVVLERSLDCRYLGQSYEIDVPYRKARTPGRAFLESFHRRHKRLYSYRHASRPVEIVNLRIKAVAVTPKIPLERRPPSRSLDPTALVKRQMIHTGRALREGTVYDRTRLGPDNAVPGPALIIDPESTTFLPPGYRARVDPYLNLVIRKAALR